MGIATLGGILSLALMWLMVLHHTLNTAGSTFNHFFVVVFRLVCTAAYVAISVIFAGLLISDSLDKLNALELEPVRLISLFSVSKTSPSNLCQNPYAFPYTTTYYQSSFQRLRQAPTHTILSLNPITVIISISVSMLSGHRSLVRNQSDEGQ